MSYQIQQTRGDLYATVRAGLLLKNTTLGSWCRENSVLLETARQALNHQSHSENAEQLRQRIMIAAGVVLVE